MADRDGYEELRTDLGAAIRERLDTIKRYEHKLAVSGTTDDAIRAAASCQYLATTVKELALALRALRPKGR